MQTQSNDKEIETLITDLVSGYYMPIVKCHTLPNKCIQLLCVNQHF
jgi:hypothetical protein